MLELQIQNYSLELRYSLHYIAIVLLIISLVLLLDAMTTVIIGIRMSSLVIIYHQNTIYIYIYTLYIYIIYIGCNHIL